MSPRLTDWSLALAVGIAFASGILSLISGRTEDWLIFALHGVAGLWLALLLWGKLRRVLPRLVQPQRWDRATLVGAGAALLVALAVGSGVWWVFGGELFVVGFNLMNWHILLGFVLTAAVSLHMLARAKPLRTRDIRGRRQMLRWATLALGGVALWPAQQALGTKLQLPGARRRFTGAREAGSYAGNAFPNHQLGRRSAAADRLGCMAAGDRWRGRPFIDAWLCRCAGVAGFDRGDAGLHRRFL